MGRRIVAKNYIGASIRNWVKNFEGNDLLREYRKHFRASRSCAIIELTAMGVQFPVEQAEEAKHKQIGAAKSHNARKAKRAANKLAARLQLQSPELPHYAVFADERFETCIDYICENFDAVADMLVELEETGIDEFFDVLASADCAEQHDPFADCQDTYDPFAD